MEIFDIHSLFLKSSGIVIDTRKIVSNSIFFALKGDRFDANTFANEALEKGAGYVIIDNSTYYIDNRTILVNDCLTTLQNLARYHRSYLQIPIIALTGSNGKTTTKELIQRVLNQKFNTKATIGNLNNHIGVPLTILSFDKETEIGVVEMGANHQKEIEFLCEIAQPDYGYITNFGKAHLEGFGGFEGVIKGKSEMYDYLFKHSKKVFVNLDDPLQVTKTSEITAFSFGINTSNATLNIDKITVDPYVTVEYNSNIVKSHLIGRYNANNISASICIGKYFQVPDEAIKMAIESYVPENNRSQLVHKNSNDIILDAYNANPSSMKVAIENFTQLENASKTVFLGDMFELGTESLTEHKMIVSLLENTSEISCFFIGKDFYANKTERSNWFFYKTFEELATHLTKSHFQNSSILIKGSRGMALERILDYL